MTLTKSNLRMLDSGFITPLDYGAAGFEKIKEQISEG